MARPDLAERLEEWARPVASILPHQWMLLRADLREAAAALRDIALWADNEIAHEDIAERARSTPEAGEGAPNIERIATLVQYIHDIARNTEPYEPQVTFDAIQLLASRALAALELDHACDYATREETDDNE